MLFFFEIFNAFWLKSSKKYLLQNVINFRKYLLPKCDLKINKDKNAITYQKASLLSNRKFLPYQIKDPPVRPKEGWMEKN